MPMMVATTLTPVVTQVLTSAMLPLLPITLKSCGAVHMKHTRRLRYSKHQYICKRFYQVNVLRHNIRGSPLRSRDRLSLVNQMKRL